MLLIALWKFWRKEKSPEYKNMSCLSSHNTILEGYTASQTFSSPSLINFLALLVLLPAPAPDSTLGKWRWVFYGYYGFVTWPTAQPDNTLHKSNFHQLIHLYCSLQYCTSECLGQNLHWNNPSLSSLPFNIHIKYLQSTYVVFWAKLHDNLV